VAGFDLTFTVPKSASVLWALGDEPTQAAAVAAHRAAVAGVLELVEARFLHTRTGAQSCAQVPARGMIAAAFDLFDTRTGDPNLHTHVVIANKVQGPDGVWRAVDGQEIYRAAVALSEVYDDLFADQLSTRLPVSWSWRDRGPRRSPAFEIDGLPDELLATFSQRAQQIGIELADLVEDFVAARGREPSRVDMLRLRQRATLATRPDKEVRPLAELRATWRATATALTGKHHQDVAAAALRARPTGQRATSTDEVTALSETVLAGVTARRSTWTRANLLAETARTTRHLRCTDPIDRIKLLDQVVERALAACVALDPPVLFHSPARFCRPDGSSVFERPAEAAFTTTAVLDAEARLIAATTDLTAPALPAAVLEPLARPMPGQRLSPDQHAAITGIATSTRRLDVLIGPAGTGKTRTLAVLTRAWMHAHGPDSVVGLAPSATAAAQLAASLQIGCENTAKWLHDHPEPVTDPIAETLAGRASAQVNTRAGSMRAGMLVIVDEASLACTAHLDALLEHAAAAGAKLLLVGDHHQLGAVEAGGAFALLADTATESGTAHTLDALWRFTNRWEADATRALRTGDPATIGTYAEHGRLRDGDTDTMTEAAYRAWCDDLAAGQSSLLIAPDRDTVSALNLRARTDRLAAGQVGGPEIGLTDGSACAVGDWISTRQNDRRLSAPGDGHVRNGATWTVTAVHADGSMEVIRRDHIDLTSRQEGIRTRQPGHARTVRLPARYVAEHVELGYATTIHRAQGATVDTAHVLARAGMTRQALYVAMTRGRNANHAYVALDGIANAEAHQQGRDLTGAQILERVLATDGAEYSATATLRHRQNDATAPRRLMPIRDTFRAAGREGTSVDHDVERAAEEVSSLLRLRAALHRAAPPRSTARTDSPPPSPARRGPGPIRR
jgi:conjugative relaxase-like TrwC/TraI family protein